MTFTKLAALWLAFAGSGCDDTTGVLLTMRSTTVVADHVSVTASGPRGSATHVLPSTMGDGIIVWPVSVLATFPADIGEVGFSVTALRNGVESGAGRLDAAAVPPHVVIHRELTLGPDDDGGAGDAIPPGAFTRSLTIHRGLVSAATGATALVDYPLLVSISDPALKSASQGGHVARDDGGDIGFSATGATCGVGASCALDEELERYDAATGTLVAWVRVPSLSTAAAAADTVLTMRYGDASAVGNGGSAKVWDSGFQGVWHLDGDARDSTAFGRDGAPNKTTAIATAKIAGGVAFDGAGAWIDVPDAPGFDFGVDADFTVSMWLQTNQRGVGNNGPRLLSKRDGGNGWELLLHTAGNDDAWLGAIDFAGGAATAAGRTNVADGAWHLITVVRQGTKLTAFEDAAPASPTQLPSSGDLANAAGLRFGALAGATPAALFAGNQDEARVSSVARSVDWILTDFNSQSSPGAFSTLGVESGP
jgi:hypothetical protein